MQHRQLHIRLSAAKEDVADQHVGQGDGLTGGAGYSDLGGLSARVLGGELAGPGPIGGEIGRYVEKETLGWEWVDKDAVWDVVEVEWEEGGARATEGEGGVEGMSVKEVAEGYR